MMLDNYAIADNFSLLGKLMDIHGDNSFKAKSYSSAAFTIEKLPVQLSTLSPDQIVALKGIGDSTGKKIIDQLETGKLITLEEYISKTPPGILEMLSIKGIGPKKIATIWKELEIESIGELLYACEENRLTLYKGFGEKTQQNIKESIQFYMGALGRYLYQQVEEYTIQLDQKLKSTFGADTVLITGEYRRQLEIINQLEWIFTGAVDQLKAFFTSNGFNQTNENEYSIGFKGSENIQLIYHTVPKHQAIAKLFETSCSELFMQEWTKRFSWDLNTHYVFEEEIFGKANICPLPPYQRETATIIYAAEKNELPSVIQPEDIRGIIHSHSNWSDGSNTLEEMAKAAVSKGLEYLVISDHSKSAFYANGLNEERIAAQHQQIDEINKSLGSFKIFKSIESDILNDGSLDYASEILNSFDLVIASIHSNLKMNEEKAMMRLLKARENPYTSILGHMTGRLLLSRNGYPINHATIIDACAANGVVIELNAHPRRLDIDWRWIEVAIQKNVLLSINPDAHDVDGYNDCKYGVLVAQKAGLSKARNLSCYSLEAFEKFVAKQKAKRG
jgi:DNA polymerase (family X)